MATLLERPPCGPGTTTTRNLVTFIIVMNCALIQRYWPATPDYAKRIRVAPLFSHSSAARKSSFPDRLCAIDRYLMIASANASEKW